MASPSRQIFGCLAVVGVLCLGIVPAPGHADVIGFADQPDHNSTNWNNALESAAGVEHIDFESHPLGSLDADHYKPTAGLELDVTTPGGPLPVDVKTGDGPGETGVDGTADPGEGSHPASRYLAITRYSALRSTHTAFLSATSPARVDLSFQKPKHAAGLFTIDLYTSSGLTLEAFDHPDPDAEEAESLGTVSRPGKGTNNYQKNQLYFIGLVDEASQIRSVRLSFAAGHLDGIGVDDLMVASASTSDNGGTPIPAPGTLPALALAAGGFALLATRQRRAA